MTATAAPVTPGASELDVGYLTVLSLAMITKIVLAPLLLRLLL